MRRSKSKSCPAGPVVMSAKISASSTGGVFALVHGQLADRPRCSASYTATGVMGDEPHQAVGRTERRQIPCTVKRMEPGVTQLGRVPDVVQPGRGDEEIPFALGHGARRFDGPRSDSLSVQPTVPERRQQRLGQLGRSRGVSSAEGMNSTVAQPRDRSTASISTPCFVHERRTSLREAPE